VADLVVPAGVAYVRAGGKEARFESRPGEIVLFENLTFNDPRTRPRGAMEDAVRRGLYANGFGRGYYSGFIDQAPDFVPVSFANADLPRANDVERKGSGPIDANVRHSANVIAGVGFSDAIATTLDASEALRLGVRPADRRGLAFTIDLSRATAPGIGEGRVSVSAGWVWAGRVGWGHFWGGAVAGGGVVEQSANGEPSRWSGLLEAGPIAGASAEVTGRLGVWCEVQGAVLAYRRDAGTAFAFAPSAFVGAMLGI
jgi:hypothetical protein